MAQSQHDRARVAELQGEIDQLTEDCDKMRPTPNRRAVSEISDDRDLLREIADDFLNNAQRCYRIARAARDIQVRERLMDLAQEFEERAEAVRARARDTLR